MAVLEQQQPDPPPPWAAYMGEDHAAPAWLRLPDVLERTRYSESGWRRAIKEGRAPEGQRRGATVVWNASVIDAFVRWEIATLPPARSAKGRRRG